MKIARLKQRLQSLEDYLTRLETETEEMTGQLSDASLGDYDRLASDITVARMKADITQDQIDQVRDDIIDEETRLSSDDYKADIKKMDSIKKDIDKVTKSISKTYDDLRSQLSDFSDLCDSYDKIARSHGLISPNTWTMSSYRWPAYLYTSLSKMRRHPRV